MPRKTYLDLVNESIAESKVTLDPLTSTNFSTPPRTVLYNLFKTWVNRAYKNVLVDRNEWFFRQERAVVTVFPRLQLRKTAVTVLTIDAGDIFVGDSSGVSFTIEAVHPDVEDVETDTTPEFTVSVRFSGTGDASNNLILNETVSRVSPSPEAAVATIKGRGRYNFKSLVPYVDDIDKSSFYIQRAVSYTPNIAADELKDAPFLEFYPWERWKAHYESFNTHTGTPRVVTRTGDGLYDFYPRPDGPFDVAFDYSQATKLMSSPSDIPDLIPEKFEDLIIWKAVAEYADYDERPRVFVRAKKNIDRFTYLLGRDALPTPTPDIYRFDC